MKQVIIDTQHIAGRSLVPSHTPSTKPGMMQKAMLPDRISQADGFEIIAAALTNRKSESVCNASLPGQVS